MDKRGKKPTNSEEEIIIIVEDVPRASTNSNLSSLQFGSQYTTTDIVIWYQVSMGLTQPIALAVDSQKTTE